MDDFAFANRFHRPPQPVEARNISRKCIAGEASDDEAQRERAQVDLMFEFPVDSHEESTCAGQGPRENYLCGTHAGVNTFI